VCLKKKILPGNKKGCKGKQEKSTPHCEQPGGGEAGKNADLKT